MTLSSSSRSLAVRLLLSAVLVLMSMFWVHETFANHEPLHRQNGDLQLLQPPDDSTNSLSPEPGIGIFFTYFNLAWPWIVGSAAGIAVLQAVIGGMQIMLSGGDSGKREEGKGRLLWAIAGLLMIGLSGMILETINPIFFRQV